MNDASGSSFVNLFLIALSTPSISPLHYVHRTQRCANVNLMTGEQYALSDIFTLNDDFMGLWCTQVEESGDYGELIVNDADTRETFCSGFE